MTQIAAHKGDNGILYIIAGSKQYHGSLWYAVETASHFVDLIYVETDVTNLPLLKALKKLHPALIPVSAKQRSTYLAKSDALLLGPGLGRTPWAKKLARQVLHHKNCPTKRVIDADPLHWITAADCTTETVVTPHAGEYRALFGSTPITVASKTWPGIIVKKGEIDLVCSGGRCQKVIGGNSGLTKGGTGDVLAAFIASLACRHTASLQAATIGLKIMKRAAEQLSKTSGTYFSTTQVIDQLPAVCRQVCGVEYNRKNGH